MNATLSLPQLEDMARQLERIEKLLMERSLGREWFDLRGACDLKGISYNTARRYPRLQPLGGTPDAYIAGRKRWNRATVTAWLKQTDTETQIGGR